MKKICRFKGCLFTPVPTVPNQEYCGKKECQQARRRRWRRNKRAKDKVYRDNQKDAQERWQKKNPGYWQKYREKNTEYTDRNRRLQRARNQKRKMLRHLPDIVKSEIAKMDVLKNKSSVISGYYKLIPITGSRIAKMDVLVVKIDVIDRGYK